MRFLVNKSNKFQFCIGQRWLGVWFFVMLKGNIMSYVLYEFKVEKCDWVGKGFFCELCCNGFIFVVIYGDKQVLILIVLLINEVMKKIYVGGFMIIIVMIDVDGEKILVFLKDYQFDLVCDFIMYVDFFCVLGNIQVMVVVLVYFINYEKFLGFKIGGMLNVVCYEVEFYCLVNVILEVIMVDLIGFKIGEGVYILYIKFLVGVMFVIIDCDFMIVMIVILVGGVQEEVVEV